MRFSQKCTDAHYIFNNGNFIADLIHLPSTSDASVHISDFYSGVAQFATQLK